MKHVLIFSGTTEGRDFAEQLAKAGISSVVCVATEYGELVMQEADHERITIHQGRMEEKEMVSFLEDNAFEAVVDATHPYAVVVSENIQNAVKAFEKKKEITLPYYRLNREEDISLQKSGKVITFSDMESCACYLEKKAGNILLTTGSKELRKFVSGISAPGRIFARVLPGRESIELCEDAGISGKQIIAMQGPFSTELNTALIRQFQIRYLVTKESGKT
ncbi:MAG: precorrin-6A reductase, partial [Roseburia sp.]